MYIYDATAQMYHRFAFHLSSFFAFGFPLCCVWPCAWYSSRMTPPSFNRQLHLFDYQERRVQSFTDDRLFPSSTMWTNRHHHPTMWIHSFWKRRRKSGPKIGADRQPLVPKDWKWSNRYWRLIYFIDEKASLLQLERVVSDRLYCRRKFNQKGHGATRSLTSCLPISRDYDVRRTPQSRIGIQSIQLISLYIWFLSFFLFFFFISGCQGAWGHFTHDQISIHGWHFDWLSLGSIKRIKVDRLFYYCHAF